MLSWFIKSLFFFFKQKTAYEMRISDWSSDVCSSDLMLVRDAAVYGTAQLPKFAEDLFRTTTGFWLIPTAEVPLTNLAAGRIIDEAALPLQIGRASCRERVCQYV